MSKVWFVTGAGTGIGAGVGNAVLRNGDRIVATGRNLDKVRAAYAEMNEDRIAFVQLDVTDEGQVKTAVEAAIERFDRIDVLVNNAAYCLLGNFEEITPVEIERQFATNFYGAAHVIRAVLPAMRRQRSGHIFNISSVGGAVGMRHASAYGATKFALEGLSESVAEEVGRFGIKVTVVEPGFFRTALLAPQHVRWARNSIDDYADEGSTEAMWSPYNGAQPGDPAKLGDALVTIANMETPPKLFAAGSDSLAMITLAVEARMNALRVNEVLSRSTDGTF